MKEMILYCLEFILAKRIHIALLVFFSVIYSLRCLGLGMNDMTVPVISALVVWGGYLENLTTDALEDGLNVNSPHGISSFVEVRLWSIEKLYPVFYGAALVLSLMVNTACFLYTAFCVIMFFSYQRPWLKIKGKWIRLKEVYIVKNLIPPVIWVTAVLIIPLAGYAKNVSPDMILFIVILFLFSFREEIKFDIPDAEGDLAAGIRTFPNVLGPAGTNNFLQSVSAVLLILFFLFSLSLWEAQRWEQLGALLRNSLPLVLTFAYDHHFTELLFETGEKAYCNIGLMWGIIALCSFLAVPYPYNWAFFIFVRLSGYYMGFFVTKELLRGSLGTKKNSDIQGYCVK